MRVTATLYRANMRHWFKKLWAVKGVMKTPPLFIPHGLRDKGIKFEDPNKMISRERRDVEPFTPPDHPNWDVQPPDTEHENYNEKPVYRFSNSSFLLEGERQAAVLTKTHVNAGLPPQITKLLGVVSIPDQDELVQRYIMQANKWDPTKEKLPKRLNPSLPGWNYKREFGIPNKRKATIMINDLLRLCQMLSGQYPEILSSFFHSRNHFLSVIYQLPEEDKQVNIYGEQEMLVTTNKPLPPFATEDEVDDTVNKKLPDLFPLLPTIDLKKIHIYKQNDNAGWQSSFSHTLPHTLWIRDLSYGPTKHRTARALMFCFGHTMALAKQKYGENVKTLPEPISMQCISTNGINFDFSCFQLNTLNLHSSDGIKNILWHDCDNALYNRIEPRHAMLRNTKYEDYDPLVLEKILAFYASGLTL